MDRGVQMAALALALTACAGQGAEAGPGGPVTGAPEVGTVSWSELASFDTTPPEDVGSSPVAVLVSAAAYEQGWAQWREGQEAPSLRTDQVALFVSGGFDPYSVVLDEVRVEDDGVVAEVTLETAGPGCSSAAVVDAPVLVVALDAAGLAFPAGADTVPVVVEATEKITGCGG